VAFEGEEESTSKKGVYKHPLPQKRTGEEKNSKKDEYQVSVKKPSLRVLIASNTTKNTQDWSMKKNKFLMSSTKEER